MQEIEDFFNKNILVCENIHIKNELFSIKNEHIFKLFVDINIWGNNIKPTNYKNIRENKQQKFSDLIRKRDKKCVVTGKHDILECEACHIVPVECNGSYNTDNGLLINLIHHKTFDDNLWCINPESMCVDVITNDKNIVGSIIEYEGKIINVIPTNLMKHYLSERWNKYIENKYKFYKINFTDK